MDFTEKSKHAPFTEWQVENLNKFQELGKFHPFTCNGKAVECEKNLNPRDYSKDGVLIATKDGWVCPCGKYTQNWAHKFMTEPLAE
jgi:hypothetical protein